MDNVVDKLKDFIIRNHELISERPEILMNIKNRLAKADDPDEMDFDNMDFQNYEDHDPDEEFSGLSIKDESEMDQDDAIQEQYLKDLEAQQGEDEEESAQSETENMIQDQASEEPVIDEDEQFAEGKDKEKLYAGRWQPNEANYTDKHKADIEEYMNQGFSHREAERLANAHDGPNDLEAAISGSRDVEEPSEAFLELLRPHAEDEIKNYKNYLRRNADASKNPELFHAGKIDEQISGHRKNFEEALKEFKNSEEFQNMDDFDQMDALDNFKINYYKENPEHKESFTNLGTGDVRSEAQEKFSQGINDALEHFLTSHMVSGEDAGMTSQEAGQHIGGEKTEGGGYVSAKTTDPMKGFAEKNPELKEFALSELLKKPEYQALKESNPEMYKKIATVGAKKQASMSQPKATGQAQPQQPTIDKPKGEA